MEPIAPESVSAAYYLRLSLVDRPGVLAEVTGALGDGRDLDRSNAPIRAHAVTAASVVIVTHEALDGDLRRAVARIAAIGCVARAADGAAHRAGLTQPRRCWRGGAARRNARRYGSRIMRSVGVRRAGGASDQRAPGFKPEGALPRRARLAKRAKLRVTTLCAAVTMCVVLHLPVPFPPRDDRFARF